MKINVNAVKAQAKDLQRRLGGVIFVFPVDEADPYSEYAFVTHMGGKYLVFPDSADIGAAAQYVNRMLEVLKKHGYSPDYERDVRFVSYQPQFKAPSIMMKKLRDDPTNYRKA